MMRVSRELFLLRRSGGDPVDSQQKLLPPTKMQSWVVICWAVLVLVGADECPDGGRCKEGQTCCSSPTSDGYKCCPFDQAECCEDHIHCCPAGTICKAATSSCVNATVSVPWAERISADQTKNFKSFRMIKSSMDKDYDTICADKSRCPAEYSCVKGLTKFGCCPVAKGVSCSDGKHCCPEGHHCSIDSRSCIKKAEVVPCNETAACRNGSTCCKNKKGDWTCCPYDKAVCCKDLKHCCPHGTKCNPDKRRCEDDTTSVPWAEKIPTIPREDVQLEVKVVPCNSTAGCPDGTTCCKNQQGGWSCCPLPEAVCCEDFIHCCPNGKKCDLAAMTCDDGLFSQPLVKKIPTIPREDVQVEVKDVLCDGSSKCPDGTTCCKNQQGGWSCCPLPEAVCCEDFIHCCPNGTKCDLAAMTCDDGLSSQPLVKKIPTIPRQDVQVEVKVVPCNSTAGCPDGTTCCKNQQGGWSCCPLPEAVCCEDFIHCCPNGKKCDLAAMTCDDGLSSQPLVKKIPTIPRQDVQVEVKDVLCNDSFKCPDETTCCKNQQGGFSCCPIPNAVCCEDFIHCCPNGRKCNLTAMTCDAGIFTEPLVKKIPSIPRGDVQVEVKVVPCNSTAGCPDGTTCCKNQQGGWSCCPLPEAVCCEDFIHCCPNGKKCDLAAMTCDDGLFSQPLVKKIPSIPRGDVQVEVKVVPCNSTAGCPDGTTCCKNQQGGWSCCPLPEAVCCEDFIHCCPNGKKCDLAAMTCDDGLSSQPLVKKIPTIPRQDVQPHEEILSQDGDYYLDDYDDDDDNDDDDDDDDNDDVYDDEKEDDSDQEIPDMKNKTKCDDHTSCPHRTTCCFIASSKKWGCCPLRKAVCCSDGVHCCPAHHKCKEDKASCTRDGVVTPWYTKIPATTSDLLETVPLTPVHLPENQLQLDLIQLQLKAVKCDDQHSCPDGTTCCHMSPTTWGCCPIPNAVCCSDFIHCCPAGTTCSGGSCTQNETPNWYNWKPFFANKKKAAIL